VRPAGRISLGGESPPANATGESLAGRQEEWKLDEQACISKVQYLYGRLVALMPDAHLGKEVLRIHIVTNQNLRPET